MLGLYWQQIRPFDGRQLQQSTGAKSRILRAATGLRTAAGAGSGGLSLDVAALRAPEAYQRAVDEITLCLAQQPLHRLQRLPGSAGGDPFLYDDGFLHDHISRTALRDHGDAIRLRPGVAHGLARAFRGP